jgi:hypothetical protein
MPHFFRVLENVKNKQYDILMIDKQVLINMPHLPNIKLQVRYNIFTLQVGYNWVINKNSKTFII